jgi:AraC-like DNA-binding protein
MYQSYAIADCRPRERFDSFRALVNDVFCPMEIDSHRSVRDAFRARVDAVNLGNVKLVRVSTDPLQVRRRPQDLAHISESPYLVKFQLRGESLWSQRGREVHARPGDFVIASTKEPYSLTFRGDYEMPVLVVPDAIMRRLTPDPDQFLGRRMAAEEADCGLLSSFVAQIVARMNQLSEPMVHRIEANVLDLLGAVLSARARSGPLTHEQLLAQVKVHIQDHLHDRGLGPAAIAAAFGISTRSVHMLFEAEPMTVGRYIRAQRIAACRRTLESEGPMHASLTDVALQWGFYDLPHMTRCFRDEYGEPPRRFLSLKRND